MLYVVGGSRIWGYVSPPPVIPKQPHKATWAEVLGTISASRGFLFCFMEEHPSHCHRLNSGCVFSLSPFPSSMPLTVPPAFCCCCCCVSHSKKKKKKKEPLGERSPGWRAPRLWGRCAGSPPPCRRHSNPPALIC